MDWIPTVFVTFKLIVLCTGMFFAVKWHYEKGKTGTEERRAVLRAAGKAAAVFLFALAGVGLLTMLIITTFAKDLSLT
jgi:hypothetical protein